MTVRVPSPTETSLRVLIDTLRQMQRGRSNAHGEFSLAVSGATSTSITDTNCQEASHVATTPKTSHASAVIGAGGFYIVPAAGAFTVHHTSTASTDCTFRYSICG